MDLLFSKYADPFSFINELIREARFSEFVDLFIDLENEKTAWEVWLHKIFEKSFDDFKKSLGVTQATPVPKENLETTIQDSHSILKSFIPTK